MPGDSPKDSQRHGFLKLRRRGFIKGVVAAGVAATGPFILIPGRAKASERLVVVNFGGDMANAKQKAFYDPFTKETGIPITAVSGPEFAKIKAQVESRDVEWDVVDVLGAWLATGSKLGLFERIDESIVHQKGIVSQARHEYAVGSGGIYAGGIGYPADRLGKLGQHPTTWPEFWNVQKIPGRRGLRTRIVDTLEIALMGDGVPASKVYPCDVERAFRALTRIKPYVNHWIGETQQTVTLIQTNETDFTFTYTTRVMNAQAAGIPIGYSFKQNLCGVGWTSVVKGTRNKDAAMRLCDFMMRPDRQVVIANLTASAPVYPDAVTKVDPQVRKWLPNLRDPGNLFTNDEWWDGKVDELTTRFKEWQLS